MGIMYKLMKHRNLTMDLSKETPERYNKIDKCRLITMEGNIIESNSSSALNSTEEYSSKDVETDIDKQFTAEHILQLCKFLAEKSKRNKNLYQQQQSPKKLNKLKHQEFLFQQMDYCDDNEDVDYYQNEALPLLTTTPISTARDEHYQMNEEQQCQQTNLMSVLSTRLSPDINSLNISPSSATTAAAATTPPTIAATSCALQHRHQEQQQHHHHHQQQQQQHQTQNQGKRDILLKIRHQIFERKRLREKGGYDPMVLNNSQVWRPW